MLRGGAMSAAAGADCRRGAELSQQLAVAHAERDAVQRLLQALLELYPAAQGQLAVLRKLLFGPKGEAQQPSAPVAAEPVRARRHNDRQRHRQRRANWRGAGQRVCASGAPRYAAAARAATLAGAPNPGRVPRPNVLT